MTRGNTEKEVPPAWRRLAFPESTSSLLLRSTLFVFSFPVQIRQNKNKAMFSGHLFSFGLLVPLFYYPPRALTFLLFFLSFLLSLFTCHGLSVDEPWIYIHTYLCRRHALRSSGCNVNAVEDADSMLSRIDAGVYTVPKDFVNTGSSQARISVDRTNSV